MRNTFSLEVYQEFISFKKNKKIKKIEAQTAEELA
jgi:hypothetical protein